MIAALLACYTASVSVSFFHSCATLYTHFSRTLGYNTQTSGTIEHNFNVERVTASSLMVTGNHKPI